MNNSDWFEELKKAKAEADTYPDGGDNDLRHKFMLGTLDKLIAYVDELREDLEEVSNENILLGESARRLYILRSQEEGVSFRGVSFFETRRKR